MRAFCIFLIVYSIGIHSVNALDQIIFKDGSYFEANVLEVTPTVIKYQYPDRPSEQILIIHIADIKSIKYENGTIEKIVFNDKMFPEPLSIGINANAGGAIPLGKLGASAPSINVEFTKGNFNSEINIIYSIDMKDKRNGGNEPMGGGILATFNYLLDTRIGQFYFGGGAGYIFNIKKGEDVRHDIIFGVNINYRYPLSSGMYFCVGPFVGGRFLFDGDFDVKDDLKLYLKPNVGVGYSF